MRAQAAGLGGHGGPGRLGAAAGRRAGAGAGAGAAGLLDERARELRRRGAGGVGQRRHAAVHLLQLLRGWGSGRMGAAGAT